MRIHRLLLGCLVLLLLLCAGAAAFAVWTVRRPFPQTGGTVSVAGLHAPVEVLRDRFGVPHLYAQSSDDLFFAQGYVHAQDRFWQMDFWRHAGSGRLAEMFGEPLLATDKFLRTLGWARVVRRELEMLDAESLAILRAYAAGVNAYLAEREGAALALEYALLGLRNAAYRPEPWEPLHSLTWAKAMAWDLGGSVYFEMHRARLLQTLPRERVEELYPPYPAGQPVILPPAAGAVGRAAPADAVDGLHAALAPAFERLGGRLELLETLLGPAGSGIGSNNWVLAGSRTATGKPILANDPHLGVQMPSIWYQNALHCAPRGPDCPYEVAGFAFPGAPGVILGHNDRIAWAFTNVGPDVMDLYVERVNPANPAQYEVAGQWVDMQLVRETIAVAGGEPVELEVRLTRHGPVVSDTFSELAGLRPAPELGPGPHAIALRWTALEPSSTFQALWRVDRARNWEEFRAAARSFDVPSQNMLYADVDGNIGYQVPGRIPVRKGADGRYPQPGWTDENEWAGFIPFDELPSALNPPRGYIVTANNAVVGADYPYPLTTDWDYGYRAQRIVELIESCGPPVTAAPVQGDAIHRFTLDEVQRMQGDSANLHARPLIDALRGLALEDERLRHARERLEAWDLQLHRDSAAAALFEAFWRQLLAATFADELPDATGIGGGSRWMTVVGNLLAQPQSAWWDDTRTPGTVEQRDAILAAALAAAVAELEQKLGSDPDAWRWGALHTTTFRSATFGRSGVWLLERLFNRGPFPTSGGTAAINATAWSAATPGYRVSSLPSMRLVADLADLGRSRAIHTTGQSGHAFHPHYVDMAEPWLAIEMHPMLWQRAQVEAELEAHLRLLPAPTEDAP